MAATLAWPCLHIRIYKSSCSLHDRAQRSSKLSHMLREALATTISSLPAPIQAYRAELLALLQLHGILYRSPSQPILSRDGTSHRWMLDSLAVTLTPRGSE